MNGLENYLEKKIRSKKSKRNSKNQSEIAACEQKATTEEPNFCSNTVFSLYFSKKISRRKTTRFLFPFLFRRDQSHYSEFDFRNHQNV